MHRFLTRGPLVRRVLAAAAALALTVTATACGSSGSSSTTTPEGNTALKVGVISIVDVAPIYLGVSKGFFKEQHLDLTLETAQGGAAIVPGVMSGQYQFGFSNTTSLLLAQSQGLPVKVVSSGNSSTGTPGKDFGAVIVKPDSPIKTAADLAGKKIAVNTLKNINTTTINSVVRQAGGDPSKIQYVELGFPDIAAAVAKGDVDAGQVVEPFLTIATQQGDRQVVSNYAGTDPNLEVGMYFSSQQYLQKNPQVAQEFTAAMQKSLTYAQEHPDEARAILSSYTKIDPKVQAAMILPKWSPDIDKAAVQKLADLAQQDGLITKPADVTALLP
ncbi:PhnD/SsuA/transferrin family substrate-binding protein [Amycolatopsis acidicola]|uniref:PhnD/SsuA/transferrin family substrate-binding protein n=1 Tax=Amycolatopsis acidicola TaxID=2596893 RepID=A0A5N0V2A7_9PSEU|nr:ABC transporter substrate-binding protein [Amycolatopsis acidicola]KAA9157427.1 PhnD/SsuA/transferrin family substrate-binding protein [Amycolatopsis acidicola]